MYLSPPELKAAKHFTLVSAGETSKTECDTKCCCQVAETTHQSLLPFIGHLLVLQLIVIFYCLFIKALNGEAAANI